MLRLRLRTAIAIAATILVAGTPAAALDERAQEREMMVHAVASMAATSGPADSRRIDRDILDAMRQVPRHLLVPADVRREAYSNRPLPIGYGATISQPYIVALMTHLLETKPNDIVLEVGTGSGYQAAILSKLVRHIYSVEIVTPLAKRAARDLAKLGYRNVTVRAGDGYAGLPARAPFDRIIVTAGADHIPRPLLAQLKPGGVLVIPVGANLEALELTVIRKNRQGRLSTRKVLPVSFVPLKRKPAAD